MSDFTIRSSKFPAGTTVGAYLATSGQPHNQAPAGSPVDTSVVGADSVLTFEGLTAGARYWAYAEVSSEHRYVTFTVDPDNAPADVATEAASRIAADASDAAAWAAADAALAAADKVIAANTQTADYTLVLGDAKKCVEGNHATVAIAVTIPPNSSVAFPVGTIIDFARVGAAAMTVAPGAGVTIPNAVQAAGTSARTITDQYGWARARKRATNEWHLTGAIT